MGGLPAPLVGLGMGVALVALCVLATWLFNWKRPFPTAAPGEHARDLQGQGLLAEASFKARRAFGVEEFEDEGIHYFLELEDGRVLFLSGQYLYDYQPPRFPCTEFTVRRHKTEGYVVDIVCGGSPIEPELTAPPLTEQDFREGPEDGDIVPGPYDAIKKARAEAR